MNKDRQGRPAYQFGEDSPSRAQSRQIAPGKVTLTSKIARGQQHSVQRKAAAAGNTSSPPAAPGRERSERDPAADSWMDMAHRGSTALVQARFEPQGATHDREDAASLPAAGGGRALPGLVQAKMEHAFGADFSAVRVHEGRHASAMGALAYAQGSDIHFAPGQYDPHSPRGQELLGHELTHVVQQRQGRVQAATGQAKGIAINGDPSLEREADELGARAARGEVVGPAARGAGNRAAASPPGAPGAVQRKVAFGDAHGVDKSGASEWLSAFHKDKGYRMESRQGYHPFRTDTARTIHIDVDNTTKEYFDEVDKLVEHPDNHKLPLSELQVLAPNVLITETKQYEFRGGDQNVLFTDMDQTLEEQGMSGPKVDKLKKVVQESKHVIRSVLGTLESLMSSGEESEETTESEKLKQTLLALLGATPEELASCVGVLHQIFSLMQQRLSQEVLEISTMNRNKTIGSPTTMGESGPPQHGDWKLPDNDVKPWLSWLETGQEFGGSLRMRLDAKQIIYTEYHQGLVHTFLHELSHAAASTRDFAYLHDDEYGKLDCLHRLANADTIALIAQELTRQLAPSGDKSESGEKEEKKESEPRTTLSREVVKAKILEAADRIQGEGPLAVAIHQLLKENGFQWSELEDEPEFKFETEVGNRIQMAML
jgi:hypothetical protein